MNNQLAFIYPPNIKKSLTHRQANKIFRNINFNKVNPERCDCCGRFVGEQSTASCLFYNTRVQFQFLGSGIPLLFSFLKSMMVLLLFLIIIVTIYGLLSNIFDKNCQTTDNSCHKNLISRISFTNKYKNHDAFQIQIYLVFLMTITWILINQIIISKMRQTAYLLDNDVETPSDFAILIKNLPQKSYERSIVDMIVSKRSSLTEQERQQTENLKIKNILLLKNLKEYCNEQKSQMIRFKQSIADDTFQDFKRKIPQIPKEYANCALVIFQRQKSKSFFIKSDNFITKMINKMRENVKQKGIFIGQNQLVIQRAPQPDDIIWENVGKDTKDIAKNKIKTFLIGVALLGAGVAIQYLFACWQFRQIGEVNNIVSVISSIIVSFTNFLITKMIVWCTQKQGNLSHTLQNSSKIIKILIFQFFNSGIFYVFVSSYAANNYTANNSWLTILYSKITTFMIINAISQSIITLFVDYNELPASFFRYLMKKISKVYYTQKRCNAIYELPDSEIQFKYSYVLRTVWLTFFFTPFAPIVSIISLIGFGLSYLVYKFLFRYCYKIPLIKSTQLNQISIVLSYSAPLLLNLGQLFLVIAHHTGSQKLHIIPSVIVYLSLSMSICYIFVPWIGLNKHFFRNKPNNNQNYDDHQQNFQITYETAYPLYQGQKSINRDSGFILTKSKEYLRMNKQNAPISKEYLTCIALVYSNVNLNSERINLDMK